MKNLESGRSRLQILEGSPKVWHITVEENSIIIRVILAIVLIMMALIPIATTVGMVFFGDGFHISLLLSYLFFWGLGFGILRMVIWNTFGVETLTFEKDRLIYVADYKYFRDGEKSISIEGVQGRILSGENHDPNMGTLEFVNPDEETKETVIQLPLCDLESLMGLE